MQSFEKTTKNQPQNKIQPHLKEFSGRASQVSLFLNGTGGEG